MKLDKLNKKKNHKVFKKSLLMIQIMSHKYLSHKFILLGLHFFFLSLFIFFSSCVSVSLPSQKGEKSKNIQYKAPESPFKKVDSENSDKTWQSLKTGNSIAYYSECNSAESSSLKQLESEFLKVINNLEVLKTHTETFNERESLNTIVEGQVDGVSVKIHMITFSKNACQYNLSYIGRKAKFEQEHEKFLNFIESFKIQ